MRLKTMESDVVFTQTSLLPRAIVDLDQIKVAKDSVDNWGYATGQKSLTTALNLAAYNYLVHDGSKSGVYDFLDRFFPLIANEYNAISRKTLPTIGVEIETPDVDSAFRKSRSFKEFLGISGLPRNRANPITYDGVPLWEFSTDPSAVAGTQSRIISELIRGRFVASINEQDMASGVFSNLPDAIQQRLSPKLVSLHVNIGYDQAGINLFENNNVDTLAMAFAIAFSSPLRLRARQSDVFYYLKDADPTFRISYGHKRIELKAMEVRDSSVYRMLSEVQHVTAAMLGYYSDDQELEDHWTEFRNDVSVILNDVGIRNKQDKFTVSQKVESTDVAVKLRTAITQTAGRVQYLIKQRDNKSS